MSEGGNLRCCTCLWCGSKRFITKPSETASVSTQCLFIDDKHLSRLPVQEKGCRGVGQAPYSTQALGRARRAALKASKAWFSRPCTWPWTKGSSPESGTSAGRTPTEGTALLAATFSSLQGTTCRSQEGLELPALPVTCFKLCFGFGFSIRGTTVRQRGYIVSSAGNVFSLNSAKSTEI